MHLQQQTVLYLRTDTGLEQATVGETVAHTLGVVQGLQENNAQVVIASSAFWSVLERVPVLHMCRLAMPHAATLLGKSVRGVVANFFFFYAAARCMRRYKVTTIYHRSSSLSILGCILKFMWRVPLLLEYHDEEASLGLLPRMCEAFNFACANQIMVTSPTVYNALVARGVAQKKILVMPPAVDTVQFDAAAVAQARSCIRTKLQMDGSWVIGFVGTFSYLQGAEMLGQIIPVLVRNHPSVQFLVLGDGPLRPYLEHEIAQLGADAQRVRLMGNIAQHQIKKYLAACDAFVLPAQQDPATGEFFGSLTTLCEYLSLGKPVVASDLPAVRGVMQEVYTLSECAAAAPYGNSVGMVVPADDAAGFVRALGWLMAQHAPNAPLFGAQARKRVADEYTYAHYARKVINGLCK